jgi:hypothetical protein
LEEERVVRFAGHIHSNLFGEVGMCDTTAAVCLQGPRAGV